MCTCIKLCGVVLWCASSVLYVLCCVYCAVCVLLRVHLCEFYEIVVTYLAYISFVFSIYGKKWQKRHSLVLFHVLRLLLLFLIWAFSNVVIGFIYRTVYEYPHFLWIRWLHLETLFKKIYFLHLGFLVVFCQRIVCKLWEWKFVHVSFCLLKSTLKLKLAGGWNILLVLIYIKVGFLRQNMWLAIFNSHQIALKSWVLPGTLVPRISQEE